MPNPVYSTIFWEGTGSVAGTAQYSNPVPGGYVWDVREIVATPPGYWLTGPSGIEFYAYPSGVPICAVRQPFCVGGVTYRWDRREILVAGAQIECLPSDNGWQFRVCGYQLTLP